MKRHEWELVIANQFAHGFRFYEVDAMHHAEQLSRWAPRLIVELYIIDKFNGAKLHSTWRNGRRVRK